MKTKNPTILLLGLTLLMACSKDENKEFETFSDTGTLFVSGGLYDCPYQIRMDDSTILHPFNFELLIPFKSGQVLNFEYQLKPESTACNGATGITVLEVESAGCLPYVDLYFDNYDSLKNDPITVNEAYIDGDCLVLKLAYSGCSNDHPIDLSFNNPPCLTPPIPPPGFFINHDSRNENCKMLVKKTLSFDLTPLRALGNGVDFNVHYSQSDSTVNRLDFTYSY